MRERLAQQYGTGFENDPEALEKLATDELIVDVLREHYGVDPQTLSPEQFDAYAQEIMENLEQGGEEEGEEGEPQYEGEGDEQYGSETFPEGMSQEDMWDEAEKEANAQLIAADNFGRTAAHAFADEVRSIKEAHALEGVDDLLDKLSSIGDPQVLTECLEKSAAALTKIAEEGGDPAEALAAAKEEAKKKKEKEGEKKPEEEKKPETEEEKEAAAFAERYQGTLKIAGLMARAHVTSYGVNPDTGQLFESAVEKQAALTENQMPEIKNPLLKEAATNLAIGMLQENGFEALIPED